MTPAILFLEKHNAAFELLEYEHDASQQNYANEASKKLGLCAQLVFKTLIVELDSREFAVAIVPSNKQLSMKKLAKAASTKKALMADAKKVQSMSGYVLGGVSPFGQKRRLLTLLDSSANAANKIYVSGGRRGLEIGIEPATLSSLLGALVVDIAA